VTTVGSGRCAAAEDADRGDDAHVCVNDLDALTIENLSDRANGRREKDNANLRHARRRQSVNFNACVGPSARARSRGNDMDRVPSGDEA
jgi:hypothetical protein